MDTDEEYDDDLEYEDDEGFDDPELEELVKPEPLAFADGYSAAENKPVELVVPTRADCFKVIGDVAEARYPAKRVAKSALALAQTLKSLLKR